MSYTRAATFDVIKSLAAASIGPTYTLIGSELFYKSRVLILTNQTDADLIFSDDGTNDKVVILSGTSFIVDIATNDASEDPWFYPAKKKWYVKEIGTPTTGSVYVASIFGRTD
jgi:hypothetical protein